MFPEVSGCDDGALVAELPIEVAQPLRDLTVSPAAMVTALLSAHMIVFWLSQDSNVTPPVALAAFTAAAIAKSSPMQTGVASWKLAKGLYIVPLLFAYTPLLAGNWPEMLAIAGVALIGIYGLAGALQGCLEHPVGWVERAILAVAGTACIIPTTFTYQMVALGVVVAVFVFNLMRGRPEPATT